MLWKVFKYLAVSSLSIIFININVFCAVIKNETRQGLSIDNAYQIAVNSIVEASGIIYDKDVVKPGLTKKDNGGSSNKLAQKIRGLFKNNIRPHDSLLLIGINDKTRLSILRRIIIRNASLGTQSYWGATKTDPSMIIQLNPYYMPESALHDLTTDETVAGLAGKIKANAGLPFLSKTTVAGIVNVCRCKANTNCAEKIKTEKKIEVEINNATTVDDFKKCLTSSANGVSSKSLTEPTGKKVKYYLKLDDIDKKLSYKEFIERISNEAFIPSSPELTGTRLVLRAIFNLKQAKINEDDPKKFINYQTKEYFSERYEDILPSSIIPQNSLTSFNYSQVILGDIQIDGNIDDDLILSKLDISPRTLKEVLVKLSADAESFSYYYRKNKSNFCLLSMLDTDSESFDQIKEKTNLGNIIFYVTNAINEQKKKESNQCFEYQKS